ncbi:hypothetical protein A6K76_04510 [Caryophanon latum]|uniref:Uncharacterized protein n=1 Tax=Caryophanon latum TaxID=33977 RepID=A0A1C0Z2Z5_9BACL|nr:hypothetical protein A6K76_04510 [Caryophanon latum]
MFLKLNRLFQLQNGDQSDFVMASVCAETFVGIAGLLISYFYTAELLVFSSKTEMNAAFLWHGAGGETPWGIARASRPRKHPHRRGAEA